MGKIQSTQLLNALKTLITLFSARRLNKLQGLKVLSREDCQQRWNTRSDEYGLTSIVKAMLCAKKNNGTACFGDSGGKSSLKQVQQ